jgi:hypothetical protein
MCAHVVDRLLADGTGTVDHSPPETPRGSLVSSRKPRLGLAGAAARRAHGLRLGARPGVFRDDDCLGLPEAARRYLRASIAPGTRHAMAARLSMRGEIRLGGRWLPFRAHEVVAPHDGFVWAARVAGVVVGTDSLVMGRARSAFSLLGLVSVADAFGEDVDRSAAGRAGAEAVWVPTSLLPSCDVEFESLGAHTVSAHFNVGSEQIELVLDLLRSGHLAGAHLARWGDPEGSGKFGWHRFGIEVTGYGQVDGLTVPAAGRVGWYAASPRFGDGIFLRFRLTGIRPIGHDPRELGLPGAPEEQRR